MLLILACVLIISRIDIQAREINERNAVVTLVTGSSSGYVSGAIALGQSLIDIGSVLKRVVMVTPDVEQASRDTLSHIWEIVEVQPTKCNHNNNLDPSMFDLNSAQYKAGIEKWSLTCTKFAAFSLVQFDRVIFMDSDMLVVGPIDDAIYGFSNASFLAAPETFPPDNLNSGFLVLNPSLKGFQEILRLNDKVGSAEGGDQGVFNRGLCPDWHSAPVLIGPDIPGSPGVSVEPGVSSSSRCGRLPWIFNVETVHYEKYRTFCQMSNIRGPSVLHFVGEAKPWTVLMLEYIGTYVYLMCCILAYGLVLMSSNIFQ
jgi:hypothetical protein